MAYKVSRYYGTVNFATILGRLFTVYMLGTGLNSLYLFVLLRFRAIIHRWLMFASYY